MNKKKKKKDLNKVNKNLKLDLNIQGDKNYSFNEIKEEVILDVENLIDDNTDNAEDFASKGKYKKLTGRNMQLNLKVTNEFREEIRTQAFKQKKMFVEIIEDAWEVYKQSLKK